MQRSGWLKRIFSFFFRGGRENGWWHGCYESNVARVYIITGEVQQQRQLDDYGGVKKKKKSSLHIVYSVTAAGHQCIGRYLNHGDETHHPPAAAAARQQKSGIEYEEQQQ